MMVILFGGFVRTHCLRPYLCELRVSPGQLDKAMHHLWRGLGISEHEIETARECGISCGIIH
jgi:hypothetical protein